MDKITNPFIVQGHIPEAYFCDREQETENLVRYITNGSNVVLSAPRRVGKSKLIAHCFAQPVIRDQYYTIFVDILQTNNLQELTYELGKAVFEVIGSFGSKMMKLFFQTVHSLRGDYSYDPITGVPRFSMSIGHIENPQYTLEEVFRFLEQADRPCIVAIDEFQRITQYPEKNVEAILRTHIQHMSNCHFIYAGSERHLLSQMFMDYNRPFYQSSMIMNLEKIERSKYSAFAKTHFEEFGKHIGEEDVNSVYDLFDGNTFAMHKTLNSAFSITPEGSACDRTILRKAIDGILGESDHDFRARLMSMSLSQKEVLYAIARSGVATQITGADFVQKYRLGSPSSVQSAVRRLLTDGWITEYYNAEGKKCYQLYDYFLTLWIQQNYGNGYALGEGV